MNYYERYYRMIKQKGVKISPRGMKTHALYDQTFTFEPGTFWRRSSGDNPAIGIIEGLQFIAGTSDKDAIAAAAPHAHLDLFGPVSFYGPKTVGQFEQAINQLTADPFTRRATIIIASPYDAPDDMPCTTAINFYRRDETYSLYSIINMRSSDAVWGMPYDMVQFGMVTHAVASCLGGSIWPAPIVVRVVNAHVYDDHDVENSWSAWRFSVPRLRTWSAYREWAEDAVAKHMSGKELMALVNARPDNNGRMS